MSAQQYGMDPNQFAQAIDQQGQIPAMVAEVARRKALATVLEQAKVVDTAGQRGRPQRADHRDRCRRPSSYEGHDHEGHDHEGHDHA